MYSCSSSSSYANKSNEDPRDHFFLAMHTSFQAGHESRRVAVKPAPNPLARMRVRWQLLMKNPFLSSSASAKIAEGKAECNRGGLDGKLPRQPRDCLARIRLKMTFAGCVDGRRDWLYDLPSSIPLKRIPIQTNEQFGMLPSFIMILLRLMQPLRL